MNVSRTITWLLTAGALTGALLGCGSTTHNSGEAGDNAAKEVIVSETTADTSTDVGGGTTTVEATLTNGTGYDIVELSLCETGTDAWSTPIAFADGAFDTGATTTVTMDVPLNADGTPTTYDIRLVTAGGGTIVVRGVNLIAHDITLRFDEGIGYTTTVGEDGETISSFDESAEADLNADIVTHDMETQLD